MGRTHVLDIPRPLCEIEPFGLDILEIRRHKPKRKSLESCDRGTADIYRVLPGHKPVIWARGLTSVTAIAFDRQGRLLATEFNTGGLLSPPTVPGALVRIGNNGQTVATLPVPGLYQPTGIAVSPDGTVYVSNYGDRTSTSSHPGEIVKITGLS
jgi:NHL repeat